MVISSPVRIRISVRSRNSYVTSIRNRESDLEEPVSVGEWLVSMLLMLIPCVNIVLMFVWAFSSREKRSKSNYFKATLIFAAIILVIYIIFIAIFGVAISSAIANANF